MASRAARKSSDQLLTTEGAARLWEEIVRGLRQAGYDQVGPEYLKLSRVLTEARTSELLQGQGSDGDAWRRIRQAASEASGLLEPLVESARLLARLPTSIESAEAPAGPRKKAAKSAKKKKRSAGKRKSSVKRKA